MKGGGWLDNLLEFDFVDAPPTPQGQHPQQHAPALGEGGGSWFCGSGGGPVLVQGMIRTCRTQTPWHFVN
jgi:hypothetical protein